MNLSRFKLRLCRAAVSMMLASIALCCAALSQDAAQPRPPLDTSQAAQNPAKDLPSQLDQAHACVARILRPLKGDAIQNPPDAKAKGELGQILMQIGTVRSKLKLIEENVAAEDCELFPPQTASQKALAALQGVLRDIAVLSGGASSFRPRDLRAAGSAVSSAIGELKTFAPPPVQSPANPAVTAKPTPPGSGPPQQPAGANVSQQKLQTSISEAGPLFQSFSNHLNLALNCIGSLQTQLTGQDSQIATLNTASQDIQNIQTDLDLGAIVGNEQTCPSGAPQAELQNAIAAMQSASSDFSKLPQSLESQDSSLPNYTLQQSDKANQSIQDAIGALKGLNLPSSRTIGGGDLIEVFALFVSFAALAILMLTFLQSKNRSMRETTQEDEPAREMRELVDMANTALTAANLALKQATAARARLVKEVEQQQAAIAQMNSDYEQERTAPRAQPDPDPYADRNSSASRQWNEVSSNDAVVTFGGNPRPSLAPDSSTDLDPIAEFRFAEPLPDYTPQPPNDAKLLTGNPVEDYNRCLEMSLSEAEDRFYGRYRDVLRLSCTNLHEHRNPNAKLLFKLDAMGNFLATSADRGQIAVLPMIGLDPADNRRLLEGVFTYPAGSGKFRLHRPAVAGVETADTFVIRERDQRGEFERVS